MTTVNASTSTEAVIFLAGFNQINFNAQNAAGVNDATHYSWLTTGGDGLLATGNGMDFNNSPPAFGFATAIDIDLSNNDGATRCGSSAQSRGKMLEAPSHRPA